MCVCVCVGAGSAMMGKEAAMACTAAVEEAVEEHYNRSDLRYWRVVVYCIYLNRSRITNSSCLQLDAAVSACRAHNNSCPQIVIAFKQYVCAKRCPNHS